MKEIQINIKNGFTLFGNKFTQGTLITGDSRLGGKFYQFESKSFKASISESEFESLLKRSNQKQENQEPKKPGRPKKEENQKVESDEHEADSNEQSEGTVN